jgi:hypothetical protein
MCLGVARSGCGEDVSQDAGGDQPGRLPYQEPSEETTVWKWAGKVCLCIVCVCVTGCEMAS